MSLFELGMGVKLTPTKQDKINAKLFNKANEVVDEKLLEGTVIAEQTADDRTERLKALTKDFNMSRVNIGKKNFIAKSLYRKRLTEKLFTECVYDIFMEALLLDEDFKYLYSDNFYKLTEDTLNTLIKDGKTSYAQIKENGAGPIANILRLCENAANRSTDEIFNPDAMKSNKEILNEKDKEEEPSVDMEVKNELDTKTEQDKTEIAEVVKDKVIETIRTEQEIAENEQEINDAIEEKLSDVNDDTAISENIRMIRIPNRVRRNTLFKSIQLNICKRVLNESAETEEEQENIKVDMDIVMAESIAYYTLLETFYTANIINITPSELREFSKELVFKN